MYIFVDIWLKILLLYRYFLETYPFIKLFFYWSWILIFFSFLLLLLVLLLKTSLAVVVAQEAKLLELWLLLELRESVAGQRGCHLLVGSLCALGRKSPSKAAFLPSLPAFLMFGPNLFQLFSMSCRCPWLGRREEVSKPFLPENQKQKQQGWGLAEKSLQPVCGHKHCVIHQRYASCILGTQREGKKDLIQSYLPCYCFSRSNTLTGRKVVLHQHDSHPLFGSASVTACWVH